MHFIPDYTRKVNSCLIKVKNNGSVACCCIVCISDFSIARGGLNKCKIHVEGSQTGVIHSFINTASII